jgi:hypothetical protein
MPEWLAWLLWNPPVRHRCPRCGRPAAYRVHRLGGPVTCPLCGRRFCLRRDRAITWWILAAGVATGVLFVLTWLLVERHATSAADRPPFPTATRPTGASSGPTVNHLPMPFRTAPAHGWTARRPPRDPSAREKNGAHCCARSGSEPLSRSQLSHTAIH